MAVATWVCPSAWKRTCTVTPTPIGPSRCVVGLSMNVTSPGVLPDRVRIILVESTDFTTPLSERFDTAAVDLSTEWQAARSDAESAATRNGIFPTTAI